MGQGQEYAACTEANKAMYQFKYEMANEVGIANQIQGDCGTHFSRDCERSGVLW